MLNLVYVNKSVRAVKTQFIPVIKQQFKQFAVMLQALDSPALELLIQELPDL